MMPTVMTSAMVVNAVVVISAAFKPDSPIDRAAISATLSPPQ